MSRRLKRSADVLREPVLPDATDLAPPRVKRVKPLEAQTGAQSAYMAAIRTSTLVFGIGPAGTGKTYVCGAMAAEALKNKQSEKLILTRPAVEAGESLGFLPGELDQKFEPFFRPFRDVLVERLGSGFVDCAVKNKKIEALPLAYMRGMTFNDCWVILDEAQNTTPTQMKMFLTRIGKNCTVIINGDPSQKDIQGQSGLVDGYNRTSGLQDVSSVHFSNADVVRSGLVQAILGRYSNQPTYRDDAGVMKTLNAA